MNHPMVNHGCEHSSGPQLCAQHSSSSWDDQDLLSGPTVCPQRFARSPSNRCSHNRAAQSLMSRMKRRKQLSGSCCSFLVRSTVLALELIEANHSSPGRNRCRGRARPGRRRLAGHLASCRVEPTAGLHVGCCRYWASMSQRDQGRYASNSGSAGGGGAQPQRSGLVPLGGIKVCCCSSPSPHPRHQRRPGALLSGGLGLAVWC